MAHPTGPAINKAQVTKPLYGPNALAKAAAPPQKIAAPPTAPLDANAVRPGEYTVVKHDTLCQIAKRFGVPYKTLLELNPHLTQGGRRTPGGDLIYPGDKVILRKAPLSEADMLREKVKAAQAELAKLKDQAAADKAAAEAAKAKTEAERDAARADADTARTATDETRAKLAAIQEQAEKAKAIAGFKSAIQSMPEPKDWQSRAHAQHSIEQAERTLALIPADDPDRPALAAKVEGTRRSFEATSAKLAELTSGKDKVTTKEKDEDGKIVERERDLELDDETLALPPEAIALASPEQKAKLIKNLYKGYTAKDEQAKILDILADAKRQGQLDATLDLLSKEKTKKALVFKSNVLESLPGVMDGANLDKLEAIVKGSSNKAVQDKIKSVREDRDRPPNTP